MRNHLVLALLLLAPALAHGAPKPLFQSKVITDQTPDHSVAIDVDITGAKELYLVVTDGGNGFGADWADWAEPRLIMADGSEKKLTEIEWKSALSGWGGVRVNSNAQGGQLRSAGRAIDYGIGTHANSVIAFNLPAGAARFKARGALDEGGTKQGSGTSVDFRVYTQNPGPVESSSAGGASHEPTKAIEQLDAHPELEVQLFASEPMMLSPSAIDIDHRGRVWVCEVVNYRKHNGERAEGDRILILEDTDGDAKADKSTVFHQGTDVNSAHGICVLGNKALISCGDEVFWLIDDNGDGKSDRKELMFTKIGGAQHDHGIHAFHFGPDGRLYFNFGNAGKQLCDKDGNLITDIHGVKCTNQNNRPYQQGMVFRCELDGSNVEVLAWNFRNNWEVAVDSYGTLWQSDNDDDGNKGVRINYVMEFGNYGYSDEMTGAGWQTPRLNLETEIPQRHWHQNDPGVVPNMLLTGAGSPTGMQVYEGDLLPSIFHGQPIHCDAGPNVVRAYITQPDGAGYKAEIVNILEGARNRWFRPSDVAVAPDGSLIVADWYDPGVGGHGMGDVTHGRLFRVTTKAALKYQVPSFKLDTVQGAVEALVTSPNEEQRFLALTALETNWRVEGVKKLLKLQNGMVYKERRARALWAVTRLADDSTAEDAIKAALHELGSDLRVAALRAGRQRWQMKQPEKIREMVAIVLKDEAEAIGSNAPVSMRLESPAVRREAAIALRFDDNPEASKLWKQLAFSEIGKDRWAMEALGIGSDLFAKGRMEEANKQDGVASAPSDEILHQLMMRMRFEGIPSLLAKALTWGSEVQDKGPPVMMKVQPLQALRALQLLQYKYPEQVSEAALTVFMKGNNDAALATTALLDRNTITSNPEAQTRLDALLKPVIGKPEFITLVEKLNLTGFEKELLDYITTHPNAPESVNAARLIAADVGGAQRFLKQADAASAKALVIALGRVSDRPAVAVMNQHFWNEKREDVRRTLIDSLALSSEGSRVILRWNSEGKLPTELKDQAALALSRSTDGGIRDQASKELPLPAAQGLANFPTLPELLRLKGDASKGPQMFMQAGCVACHRVKGQYIDFGPDLTQIGGKLSAEGLFTAILYPSAAIEHSFIGQQITTKEGQTLLGYIVSDTDSELTLRIAGGASQAVKKASITKKEELKQSLMPPGLAATIGAQGLADLVAWLQTLK